MKKKKAVFNKTIIKPITEEKKIEEKIEEVTPVVEKPVIEKVKPIIVKKEKKIINAVSIVVLDNGSAETKKLLENLKTQKTKYYPETEIVTVTEDNVNLLDLTKGEYVSYIKEPKEIAHNFLHQLYVNMRSGKDSCEVNGILCTNRKLIK